MSRITRHPICPKCGYDQAGEIATWETSCPIHGTCPECGLEFEWANVFDPGRVLLPWYVEHATTNRAMYRRAPATLWMMLIPNRFWKRLTVHYPVHSGKIWAFVLASVIATYVISFIFAVCITAFSTHSSNQFYAQVQPVNPAVARQMGYSEVDMTELSYWTVSFANAFRESFNYRAGLSQNGFSIALMMLAMSLLWMTVMTAVPVTRRRAKIRIAHVNRAMALSCIGIVLVYLLALTSDSILALVSTGSLTLNIVQHSGSNGGLSYSYSKGRFFQIESIANLIMTICFAYAIIWVQWFWIAAIVRGWQIRSIMLSILGFIASLLAGYTVFMYLFFS